MKKDMEKFIDLTGQKFNRLTFIKRVYGYYRGNGSPNVMWLCKCDCGKEIISEPKPIKLGYTKSCGCYSAERKVKHGMTKTRMYKIWSCMRNRCYRKTDISYKRYGGRGITVCDEWRNSFENFRDWACGHGYKEDLTLDRIDVNGKYEPNNCRWADMKTQCNNRQNNIRYECNGKNLTLSEWEEITGNSYGAMKERIKKGWDIESALFAPKGYKYSKKGKYETTHD